MTRARLFFNWVGREIRDMAFLFVILLVFIEVLNVKIATIKTDFNSYERGACITRNTNALHQKFDDLITTLVSQQLTAERLNVREGNMVKASADAHYADRELADKVAVIVTDCSKPILP